MNTQTDFKTALAALPELKFRFNYNNKLNCDCYTTIRLASSKYKIGDSYKITLNGRVLHAADIVDIGTDTLPLIPAHILRMDTGLERLPAMELVQKIYPMVTNWHTQKLQVIFLKKHRT